MSVSATRFDEKLYLDQNPDLRAAMASGAVTSAFEHWITSGRLEGRPGSPLNAELAAEHYLGHAAPPAALRLRVHGDEILLNFIRNGQVIAGNVSRALPSDLVLVTDSRILDFGCGCGRVISLLKRLVPGQYFGTDIDRETIDWCATSMGDLGTFEVNGFWPPSRYPDSFFDLIFSISIFTHLPEDMQSAWLEELARIMKPGGCTILTVQGSWLFPRDHLSPIEAGKFDDSGFYYYKGDKTDGLPEFYRSTYHSEKYIRQHWSKFFDIERIIPRGVNNHQDIVVCRKYSV
jgi:SAM-dependent methyltransferase